MKAIRSLEIGKPIRALGTLPNWPRPTVTATGSQTDSSPLMGGSDRCWRFCAARWIRWRRSRANSGVDPWFVERHRPRIVEMERRLLGRGPDARSCMQRGEAPRVLATRRSPTLADQPSRTACARLRDEWDVTSRLQDGRYLRRRVRSCATPYFYGTYEDENEATPTGWPRAHARDRLRPDPDRPGHRVRLLLGAGSAGHSKRRRRATRSSRTPTRKPSPPISTPPSRLYFEPLDEESVRDLLRERSWRERRGTGLR